MPLRWRPPANALLAALLAPPCAVCRRVIDRPLDGAVCADCWAAVAVHAGVFSLGSVPVGRSLGAYDGALRDIIHAFKYEGRRSVAPALAHMMRTHAGDLLADADLIVPVPLHRRRLRQRGFNQAEDLARGFGLPVARALTRTRATRPQVELPAEARLLNVRNAFALARPILPFRLARQLWSSRRPSDARRRHDSLLRGKVVVLVDDVATTGATLDACAALLASAGAAQVRALTAARVLPVR